MITNSIHIRTLLILIACYYIISINRIIDNAKQFVNNFYDNNYYYYYCFMIIIL